MKIEGEKIRSKPPKGTSTPLGMCVCNIKPIWPTVVEISPENEKRMHSRMASQADDNIPRPTSWA